MSTIELKWFYNKLVETKQLEAKQRDEAIKSAKQAREAAKVSNKFNSHKGVLKRRGRK